MAHNDAYHLLFKTIIIGDSGVGKSCVVTRFQENLFDERVDSTLGVEFGAKTLVVNNHKIRLAIWDTVSTLMLIF
jgi:GTPase SAR1 family protein